MRTISTVALCVVATAGLTAPVLATPTAEPTPTATPTAEPTATPTADPTKPVEPTETADPTKTAEPTETADPTKPAEPTTTAEPSPPEEDKGPAECSGTADEAPEGDIVVKKDKACYLKDLTIKGRISVEEGGSLILKGTKVAGPVSLKDGAFIDATDAHLYYGIRATNSEAYLNNTEVRRHTAFFGSGDDNPYFLVENSKLRGTTIVKNGMVYLADSEVWRQFNAHDGAYADVFNSHIVGRMSLVGNDSGVTVCGTEVKSNTWIAENTGVNIGQVGLDLCEGTNEFHNGLLANRNKGELKLSHSNIKTIAAAYGNENDPIVGEGVTADSAYGQFKDLIDSENPTPRADASTDVAQRTAAMKDRRAARHAAAMEKIADAGVANLR